jgi:Sec-independent protein translocase protein TatA
MNFFNIGTGEFLFLILLAILLVGPGRTVQFLQQGRRLVSRVQGEWRAAQQAVEDEVKPVRDELLPVTEAIRQGTRKGMETLDQQFGALEREATTEARSLKQDADQAVAELEALREDKAG